MDELVGQLAAGGHPGEGSDKAWLVLLLIVAGVLFLTLFLLCQYWELGSLRETAVEGAARLVPRPFRTPLRVREMALRGVCSAVIEGPAGDRYAVPHLIVRLAPADAAMFAGSGGTGAFAGELAQVYRERARRRQWLMPTVPTVDVVVDNRLHAGWVRVHTAARPDVGDGLTVESRLIVAAPYGPYGETLPLTPSDPPPPGRIHLDPADVPRHQLISVGDAPPLRLERDGTLGRASKVDVQCPHPLVSREHANLIWTAAGWSVLDLNSKNGTYVNGFRVEGRVILVPGQRITFGRGGPQYDVRDPSA